MVLEALRSISTFSKHVVLTAVAVNIVLKGCMLYSTFILSASTQQEVDAVDRIGLR